MIQAVLNPVAWVVANLVLFYITAVLVAFVAFYGFGFNWRSTSAGKSILAFMSSLLGIVALFFIGVFVNPRVPWWEYPPDVLVWRPIFRLVVMLAVAVAITYMFTVAYRRWVDTKPLALEVDPRRRVSRAETPPAAP